MASFVQRVSTECSELRSELRRELAVRPAASQALDLDLQVMQQLGQELEQVQAAHRAAAEREKAISEELAGAAGRSHDI